MAIDRWFIGGGAEHTPESARRLLYASTSGAEGVSGADALRVLPLAVPGGGVRATIGSALILSRYVGGETQTYMGTVYSQETVSIGATGSGSARSDLIVLRVEDPFAAGSAWPTPSPVATAPYIHLRVISGVPSGTTRLQDVAGHANETGVTLARVDLPASTGTVTTAMITDLREIAQPRRERLLRVRALETGETSNLTATTGGGQIWPTLAGDLWGEIDIPSWATRAQILVRWNGGLFNGNVWGDTWARLGESGVGVSTDSTRFDSVATSDGFQRAVTESAGTVSIPAAMRGTKQKVYPMGRRDPAAPGASIARLDPNSSLVLDIEFSEGRA